MSIQLTSSPLLTASAFSTLESPAKVLMKIVRARQALNGICSSTVH